MSEEKKLDEFELDDDALEGTAGGRGGVRGVDFICNGCGKEVYCNTTASFRCKYCGKGYDVLLGAYSITDPSGKGVNVIKWYT